MSGEEVYTTFIEGELKIERERRTNLEGHPPLSVADKATMTHMRTTKRDHSDEEARSIVAHLHIGTLETIREGNDRKIQYVAAAQVCQILALVAVSVAAYVMITGA